MGLKLLPIARLGPKTVIVLFYVLGSFPFSTPSAVFIDRGTLREFGPLLKNLRPNYPDDGSCDGDHRYFGRPSWLSGQHQPMLEATMIKEVLQQTFNLFSSQESSIIWEKGPLNELLNAMSRSLEDALSITQGFASIPKMVGASLEIKKYFLRITLYLKEKKYVPCAWEVVRAEIMKSFS